MGTNITKDLLWKGIIESLFEDFVYFFFPKLSNLVDFSKGYQFLDKELEQLYPETASINRRVDKLAKVYLKSGEEQWILIHVEVQGYRDPDFAERMFIYYYRIKDRYRKSLTSLVILTDSEPSFHPTHYEDVYFGTAVHFSFNTYKLLKVEAKSLAQHTNPFAISLEVARIALNKGKISDANLYSLKVSIVRKMKKRGYERVKIAELLKFLHYYVSFEKRENYYKFENEINVIYQTQRPMGLTEIIEKELIRQGKVAGIQMEKIEALRTSWEEGLSIELAAKIARLPEEEVEAMFAKFEREKNQ